MKGVAAEQFRFGEFELDAAQRRLSRDGVDLSLNPKAFDLLLELIRSSGTVVSKDELLERVWPDQIVEENNLSVHVSALRKLLGDGGAAKFIATVPGKGYSFVAPLEYPKEDLVVERRTFERVVVEHESDPVAKQLPNGRRHRWWPLIAALCVLAVGVAGGLWWSKGSGNATKVESIAVLPFEYQGSRAEADYLSDGVTESLINNLSQLPNLTVKARSSVFKFKGQNATPKNVASQLNVQAVLLGKIVEAGDSLALNIEVVNAATGDQIWGQRYERKLTDIATLTNEIASDVAGKLRLRLGAEPIARGQTKDSEAYELYLRGRFLWNKRRKEDHKRALELFDQALARDPNFALAHAAIADVYSIDSSPLPSEQADPLARAAIQKALAIEPLLGEAYASLGNLDGEARKWKQADDDYLKAIELNPGYAEAHHWRGEFLTRMNRPDEAIAEMKTALLLDPFSQVMNNDYSYVLEFARRPEEALAQARRSHEMNADWGTYDIFWSLEYLERYDDALDTLRDHPFGGSKDPAKIGAFNQKVESVRQRLRKEGRSGYWRGWADIFEKEIAAHEPGEIFYATAVCYSELGEYDKALDLLERGIANNDNGITLSYSEPHFDPLRQFPRYWELMKRLGFEETS